MGTQIRAARYLAGEIEANCISRLATQIEGKSPEENIVSTIRQVWPEDGLVTAIGIASPGPLDLTKGMVIKAPNIPQWINFPIVDWLHARFEVPVFLDNDANLAALGEWRFGAGQGHKNLIYLTISTGIGGGIIINNQILHGDRGLAAELGHITVNPNGPRCACGQFGHLEAVASGTAIAQSAITAIQKGEKTLLPKSNQVSARMVAQAAQQGDSLSIQLFSEAGTYIGRALADFLHIFNPTAIIIGGGVAQSGELILRPIRQAIQKFCLSAEYLHNLEISTASLGEEPGLVGALVMAQLSGITG